MTCLVQAMSMPGFLTCTCVLWDCRDPANTRLELIARANCWDVPLYVSSLRLLQYCSHSWTPSACMRPA